jgi:3',5'-cyclic AMP phosphodiesterase CpdA
MKFIHISDLHFHRHDDDNAEIIETLEYIKNHYANHHLIVTGDIVDDGHEKQYEKALAALQEFEGRISIAPGNHDFGAAGFIYDEVRAERFDRLLATPLDQDGTFSGDNAPVVSILKEGNDQVMLIALDTNLETETPFDFSCGEIGEKQLNALGVLLCNPETHDMTKLVFFHHHPFMRNDPFMELKDAAKLWPVVYLKVDVLLFGHKHESEKWENKGGVKFVLASDNSPGKAYAREITVKDKKIKVKDIKIA